MLIPMRLWLGGSLIGLAVLLLLILESSFIRRLYLSLCTKLRDFRLLVHIVLTRRKLGHIAHQDIGARFWLRKITDEEIYTELQKHIAEDKRKEELKQSKKRKKA